MITGRRLRLAQLILPVRLSRFSGPVTAGAATKSFDELKQLAESLGIHIPEGKPSKNQILKLLQKYYWEQKNPGKPLPEFEDPQLIQSIKDIPEAEHEKMWKDDSGWAIEQKRNGIRCLGYIGAQNSFTSRNVSVEDYLPESLTAQLWWLDVPMADLDGTVVDGEIISTKKSVDMRPYAKSGKGTLTNGVLQATVALLMAENSKAAQEGNGMPLAYVLYDIIKLKGRDVKNVPYVQRRDMLGLVHTAWQKQLSNPKALILNESTTKDKKAYYEKCISEGAEGCVLKLLQGVYKPGPTRTKQQLKVKRELEFDAVVSGAVPPKSGRHLANGWAGGLVFSIKDINDGKWYKIAAVSGISDEMREAISEKNPDGSFKDLKPGVLGQVWEVQGMALNKNLQLEHARMIRPRSGPEAGADAKSADEATYDRQALLQQFAEETGNA